MMIWLKKWLMGVSWLFLLIFLVWKCEPCTCQILVNLISFRSNTELISASWIACDFQEPQECVPGSCNVRLGLLTNTEECLVFLSWVQFISESVSQNRWCCHYLPGLPGGISETVPPFQNFQDLSKRTVWTIKLVVMCWDLSKLVPASAVWVVLYMVYLSFGKNDFLAEEKELYFNLFHLD